ncbi:MAG: outer membrane protein assembly factor BamB [Verrucomicrobiales bacterium]|jgi:outer membrane protein assembly factor BamB
MIPISMSRSRPKLNLWFPISLFIVLAILLAVAFRMEEHIIHTMRQMVLYLVIIVAVVGLSFWWIFLTGKFRAKFLLIEFCVAIVLIGGGLLTVEYKGSGSGDDPFSFGWKWTPKPGEGIADLPETGDPAIVIDPASSDPDLADFPGFLGPNRDGVIADPGLNPDWKTNPPKELWRIEVGIGWSGFAVVGERAVTQEQRGEEELVTCYHVKTGQFLWAHRETTRFSESMGGDGPRATPSIADGVVYALGATGILNALKIEDGSVLWSRPTLKDAGNSPSFYGETSSPLVTDQFVIVTVGAKSSASLLAYHRETGDLAWKSGNGPASYSSPRLIEFDGKAQIVSVFGDHVAGFELVNGEQIWRHSWPGSYPKVGQPLLIGSEQLLVTASYGVSSTLLNINGAEAKPVWERSQMKTKFSSAVVKDGYAWGIDEGKLICIDVATGDRRWKGQRYGYGQNLLVGDLILIQAESGDVVLVEANPDEHVELARVSVLSSKTWNPPALAGKYLIVRNDREAVGLKLP